MPLTERPEDFAVVAPANPQPAPPPPCPERRVAGWQLASKLHCPAGHLINRRDTFLTGTLVARCDCGRAMLAVAAANLLTNVSPPESLVFTVEITKAEASWVQRERPSLQQLLARAGLLLGAP